MLEELDRVDWARLNHAYGSAADVPGQIRALRSPDAGQRADALWNLFGNIFHQGTRYEATAYAVPFLLEVLAAPDTADRAGLLELLSSIAIGYDSSWLPAGLPIAELRLAAVGGQALAAAAPHPGDDDFDEDEGDFEYLESLSDDEANRLFAYLAVTAYDAVGTAVGLFRTLLTDPDAAVRTRAAYALAWFPEQASESTTSLAAATGGDLADPDGVVAATAVVAIGLLNGRPDTAALDDPRPLVRWAAAIALANVEGEDVGRAVVDELLAWAGGSVSGADGVPFLEGDLAGYAGLALGQVGQRHIEAIFAALLARIPAVSGPPALPIVGQALRIAFPAGALPRSASSYANLDHRQRRLINALIQSPATWLIDGMDFGNFSELMRGYGLPTDPDALRAYAETHP